jgi:hypothetical protein
VGAVLGMAVAAQLVLIWFSIAVSPFAPQGWARSIYGVMNTKHPLAFLLFLGPIVLFALVGAILDLVSFLQEKRTCSPAQSPPAAVVSDAVRIESIMPDPNQETFEAVRSETSRVLAPYEIAQRPMPEGEDLDRLLPPQVGAFTRTELRRPADLYRDPVYAQYLKDKAGVFVELGICGDARGAQEALATAKAETVSPTLGAFLAWTRGGYYFSVHAKGGEGDLESFVKEFPY